MTPADLIYPHTLQEWIALASVLMPFLGLAVGAIWRAWTYHREQKQKEWERLHELLKTLHNKDHDYGPWAQLAAAHELRTVRINRTVLAAIVSSMLAHWNKPGANASLIDELKKISDVVAEGFLEIVGGQSEACPPNYSRRRMVGTAQARLCPPYFPVPQPFPPTSFAKVSRRPMVRLNTGLPGAESLSRTK